MNGYDYRGRKLAVSYSRTKDDEMLDDETVSMSDGFDERSAAEDAAAYAAATKASGNEAFGAPHVEPSDDSEM